MSNSLPFGADIQLYISVLGEVSDAVDALWRCLEAVGGRSAWGTTDFN